MAGALETVSPRDAATVALVREPDLVYLTRRPASLRVGAGFYVFPGGVVEEQDREYAARRPRELQAAGLGAEHAAFVAAAIRETFEEVGLLLAYDEAGKPLWLPEGAGVQEEALRAARRRLLEGSTTLLKIVADRSWRLAGERLGYVVRWVTPPAAPLRFNTRFFIIDVTGSVEPEPYAPEVSEGLWLSLREALARHAAGELPLMRPTKAVLQRLSELGGAVAAKTFMDAAFARVEIIEPNTSETLLAVLSGQGVVVAPVPSPTLPPADETNVYVVAHGGEAVIIDAGCGGEAGVERLRSLWRRLGRPTVKALLLTHSHPDHAGGASFVQQAFDCPVWAHRCAEEVLQKRYGVAVNRSLSGGETIAVGAMRLDVLHAPGHAPDHLCFFLRERAVLFTGDNVVGRGSSWVGPPDGDMAQYLRTLAMLKRLPARIIAPGHGPPLDEPASRIEALIRRRLRREADIVRLLVSGPKTAEALADALYRERVPEAVMEMARRTVVGHLLKLEREGRVRRKGERWAVNRSEADPERRDVD